MKKLILFFFLFISCLAYSEGSLFDDNLQKPSEEAISAPITVTFLNGQLTIENAPLNSKVEIFTMLGVCIFHDIVIEPKQFFLLDLNKGYYIIKVAGLTKKISVK